MTPIEKLKKLKKELIKQSIDGEYITIIDKNGKPRNYKIRDYAEMCVYTESMTASSQATVNIAVDNDGDLVQVSNHNTICPICQQYEGNIYSISGTDKEYPFYDNYIPAHPRCKHSLTVVFKEILKFYKEHM